MLRSVGPPDLMLVPTAIIALCVCYGLPVMSSTVHAVYQPPYLNLDTMFINICHGLALFPVKELLLFQPGKNKFMLYILLWWNPSKKIFFNSDSVCMHGLGCVHVRDCCGSSMTICMYNNKVKLLLHKVKLLLQY